MSNTKEEFRPLPETYEAYGYKYKQVKRGKVGALYMATNCARPTAEIFVIKEVKATESVINGAKISVPRREKIPGKECFGKWAWCTSAKTEEKCLESAMKIFEKIENKEIPKQMEIGKQKDK